MSYTAPTVDDFHARFPEFDEADDDLITLALADAGRHVDTSWKEGDFATAILFLAAHYIQSGGGVADTAGIKSFSIGAISVTYADSSKISDPSTTSYGQRYLDLLIANKRGPRVA